MVLAPWLLDAGLLARLADDRAPVLVAALRDPTTEEAVAYRRAVAATAGGGRALTAAGFEAFLATAADLDERSTRRRRASSAPHGSRSSRPRSTAGTRPRPAGPGVALVRVG